MFAETWLLPVTWAHPCGEQVKVYVVPSDNGIEGAVSVRVDSSETSARLSLTVQESDNVEHVLDLPALYDPIEAASAKVMKSGKVILTLTKKEGSQFTWFDLRKAK